MVFGLFLSFLVYLAWIQLGRLRTRHCRYHTDSCGDDTLADFANGMMPLSSSILVRHVFMLHRQNTGRSATFAESQGHILGTLG